MHILIKNKYLIYDNYKVKCALGKRGIGLKRREGDLITPKGTFKIKQIFYRYDRIKKLETSIKKYKINSFPTTIFVSKSDNKFIIWDGYIGYDDLLINTKKIIEGEK